MKREEFIDPSPEFRGVTLWMLNDLLEPVEMRRQLRGFRDAGWGAVITRTFNGLRTPYLGDEWHGMIRGAIDMARELGMKIWLQAGYMPSAVPELPAGDEHRVLVRRRAARHGGQTGVASPGAVFDPGAAGGQEESGGETVLLAEDGWEYVERKMPHVLDLLNPEACASYLEGAYSRPIADRHAEDLGKTVEAVWVDEPHFEPPLLPWSPLLPGAFSKSWGHDIVRSLPSLFAETGDYMRVRHRYWRTVLSMLLDAYFTRVSAWCAAHGVAFTGHLMGEDTLQAQVSWTAACMPCYESMGVPGIDHLTRSLRWPADRSFILTPVQCASAAEQLGKRAVLAEMYGVSTQGLSFEDRKRIGDWLMALGVNFRCIHGSFYSLRGRRKRVYAPHLSHQQPWWPDNRVVADYFARLSYALRRGTRVADTLVIHPVESAFCVFDAADLSNPYERVAEPAAVRVYTEALIALSEDLLSLQRGFEYGDETLMARHGRVEGSRLVVGRKSYALVILPPLITLRRTTVRLLSDFAAAGGVILSTGRLPDRMDGEVSGEVERLCTSVRSARGGRESLRRALDQSLPADLRLEPAAVAGEAGGRTAGAVEPFGLSRVLLHERRDGDRRIVFVHNASEDKEAHGILRSRSARSAERWDPASGDIALVSQESAKANDASESAGRGGGTIAIPLALAPGESELFVLSAGELSKGNATLAGTAYMHSAPCRIAQRVAVGGPFAVSRAAQNALPLDVASYRTRGEVWSQEMPIAAIQETLAAEEYRGTVSLRFRFQVRDPPGTLQVVVEDAAECAIAVNGIAVHYDGLPFYVDRSFLPVEATACVRPGENTVEITRAFEPPIQPRFRLGGLFQTATGVELESVFLVGSFAVASRQSAAPSVPRCARLAPSLALDTEPETTGGDLTAGGWPFYAGRIVLERTIRLRAPVTGERVFVVLGSLDAALARVSINGRAAGAIWRRPYETEVTGAVQGGQNSLAVGLVTTLRNLLGPHHRPDGEPDQVWADGWTGLSSEGRRDTRLRSGPDWWRHRDDGTMYWTDDYFVLRLGVAAGLSVEYRTA